MSQPGRGPATSRPSLRLFRDDRVRDIGVPPSPMPCCGCQQTAERTMTWQDSSPNLIKRGIVLVPSWSSARRKGAAARGSARLRASLDGHCARRPMTVQAGTEKRRSNRTELLPVDEN